MFRNVYFEEIGLTGTQMGIIGFLISFVVIVAQPAWGIIADWKGVTKLILYVAAIGSCIAVVLYPFAPLVPATFLFVALVTVAHSLFQAPMMPIANSLVLSTGLSYEGVRVYGSVAFGVAGLAIGYLIGIFETELIFFAFALGMVLIVALLVFLPVDEPAPLGTDLSLETIRPLLNRQYLLLLMAAFLMGLMTPAGSAYFSVYIRAVGHGDWVTGIAWLIKTLAEAAAFLYIAKYQGGAYRRLIALAGLFYGTTYVILLLTGSIGPILIAQLFLGVGFALFNLASVNLAHQLSPQGLKSTAQSLLMVGGSSAGVAIGELATGGLLDLVGAQLMYGPVALLGILVVAVSLLISRNGGPTRSSASH